MLGAQVDLQEDVTEEALLASADAKGKMSIGEVRAAQRGSPQQPSQAFAEMHLGRALWDECSCKTCARLTYSQTMSEKQRRALVSAWRAYRLAHDLTGGACARRREVVGPLAPISGCGRKQRPIHQLRLTQVFQYLEGPPHAQSSHEGNCHRRDEFQRGDERQCSLGQGWRMRLEQPACLQLDFIPICILLVNGGAAVQRRGGLWRRGR